MTAAAEPDPVLQQIVAWGEGHPAVRAMLLTSTRALPDLSLAPGAVVDRFSDYDVVLVLAEVAPFARSRAWLAAFGQVLAAYQDPLEYINGYAQAGAVVQFYGGLKIDFTLLAVGAFQDLAAGSPLPAEYDAGYRLLLDKDGLAANLPAPTYQAYQRALREALP